MEEMKSSATPKTSKGSKTATTKQRAVVECINCHNMTKNLKYLEKFIKEGESRGCTVCSATTNFLKFINKNIEKVYKNIGEADSGEIKEDEEGNKVLDLEEYLKTERIEGGKTKLSYEVPVLSTTIATTNKKVAKTERKDADRDGVKRKITAPPKDAINKAKAGETIEKVKKAVEKVKKANKTEKAERKFKSRPK